MAKTAKEAVEAIIRAYNDAANGSPVDSFAFDIPKMARMFEGAWSADPKAGRVPARFRTITPFRVAEELRRLSRLSESDDLQALVKGLHQPTILALADFGCCILGRHRLDRRQIAASAKVALKPRPCRVEKNSRKLRKTKLPMAQKGAPENRRVRFVRQLVTKHYSILTGKTPTMSGRIPDLDRPAGGKFFDLLMNVFDALNIEASVEAQAAVAAYGGKAKRVTRTSL
ncbi:hypothetical protein [Methylocella sp.]|jgi:hypothetical protein|uniref:hypothetical protein n=1 Tax=Methylocella sp. TaxID=1978226 RepID=UPI003C285793